MPGLHDWSDVRVKLFTRQSQRRAAAETPASWWLDLPQAAGSLGGCSPAPTPLAAAASRMACDKPPMSSSVAQAREAVEPPPWVVEATQGDATVNRHPGAVAVEMLDAAPVSRNEAITVTHKCGTPPASIDWKKITGVAARTLDIPAQATRRLSVAHAVTAPKGAVVANLP